MVTSCVSSMSRVGYLLLFLVKNSSMHISYDASSSVTSFVARLSCVDDGTIELATGTHHTF